AQIKRMIERQKEKYGWEFIFLGANMDAVAEAARYGISSDRAVTYENDSEGIAVNFEAVGQAVCSMRSMPKSKAVGGEWSESIRRHRARRQAERDAERR
ncbi:MAG: hypothetical protein KBS83_02480, partial [Lachnospiraceae bacterium]|nr:hypothetical protein [Candidatus Equihabitans merdae]